MNLWNCESHPSVGAICVQNPLTSNTEIAYDPSKLRSFPLVLNDTQCLVSTKVKSDAGSTMRMQPWWLPFAIWLII